MKLTREQIEAIKESHDTTYLEALCDMALSSLDEDKVLVAANARAEAAEERERMRLAGISTAAFGYWKEGDSIHPDYDTVALRDVAKLFQKYVAAESRLREVAEQVREACAKLIESHAIKIARMHGCNTKEGVAAAIRTIDLDKIVAPQVSTAKVATASSARTAPSHEGVGQGAPASATPLTDAADDKTMLYPNRFERVRDLCKKLEIELAEVKSTK
jgi:hypothetical protein